MLARRLQELPPYLFARIEKKIAAARERGEDVISLGIGDPDRPTPTRIMQRLDEAAHDPENHRYPSSVGLLSYREAVAGYYQRRFGVSLDPRTQVINLIGSKEGIAHISFCYVDPGDENLVPDPGYPVYGVGTGLAGGVQYSMPLLRENGFLPDLGAIPPEVAGRAKLMFLNYPNNPTGALAPREFFADVVAFARQYDVIVCHDAAYVDLAFDGRRPVSFLEVPGALEVGIEFGSLSKPYNMTGWRCAWAAGRADVIDALATLKSNIDSGNFQAVQEAGITALNGPQDSVAEMCRVYQERCDIAIRGLNAMGWNLEKPGAGFYIWAPVPRGFTSESFCEHVLEKARVVITPGNGYGAYGEGYFRIAITVEKERLQEALDRMRSSLGRLEF